MSAVGIFAGRGDVILAMGLSVMVGFWLGYQGRLLVEWVHKKRGKA